jgi:hypothetical protein
MVFRKYITQSKMFMLQSDIFFCYNLPVGLTAGPKIEY